MAAPRRGTFAFDLSRPLKRGILFKQGGFHKAFKNRDFILYPGFLVYYENENKWRLDLTKGETLGGRLGAVKLKGATVGIARNAPKACKFALSVDAPDPFNMRKTYLMSASSKEERDSWIEAIRKAIPKSPRAHRKDVIPREAKPKPVEPKSSSQKNLNSPPAHTDRQDTACEAAIAVASCTDTEGEQKTIEEMITGINSSLKEPEVDALERHNTATLAAISLAEDTPESPKENGLVEEEATSIDLILGKREPTSEDDNSSCFSGTPEAKSSPPRSLEFVIPDTVNQEQAEVEETIPPKEGSTSRVVIDEPEDEGEDIVLKEVTQDITEMNQAEKLLSPEPFTPDMSPSPEGACEMETEESVDDSSKTTVMTMVTVACSEGSSPDVERKAEGEGETAMVNGMQEGEGEGEKAEEEEEKKEGEGEEEEETSSMNGGKRDRSSSATQILVTDVEKTTLSVNLNAYDSNNTLSDEESHDSLPELVENGEKSPSPKHSPVIKIKEDRTGSLSSYSSNASSTESSEATKLAAPANQRRSSTPFVEKKGYLYKMGGQRKTWKLRYFVLRPGAFQYFKDTRLLKVIGEVKLKNMSIFFPGIGERKQSFQFTVHTESSWNKRADWVFAGQSEREMKEWITAFKLAGGLKVLVDEPDDEPDGND